MELLAPGGSKESFIRAIEAGADSIYVGTKNYNARIGANNLSLYDLQVLINYAREHNVKTYITFNTLIKHSEINDAIKTINHILKLKPDALILQDLGLIKIISNYFPNIPMHASTQMAVHNSEGVKILKKLGFKRAILARELTFSEIKSITKKSDIEIEIFCHGALCFCVSGMCLFSSLIGGYSGNRGFCTQPCRRLWKSEVQDGYLFSPRDLELASFVQKLKKAKVKSLKIEGRMRSSEYVYKTVKAYRMLIDASDSEFNDALKVAKNILNNDYARKKSICMFKGKDEKLFEPGIAQCLGKEIGHVTYIDNNKVKFKSDEELKKGYRIRAVNPKTDSTIVFKLQEFEKDGDRYIVQIATKTLFSRNDNAASFPQKRESSIVKGNPVFLVGSNIKERETTNKINSIYNSYNKKPLWTNKINNTYTSLLARVWNKSGDSAHFFTKVGAVPTFIWIKIDNPSWIPDVNTVCDRLIFVLNKQNINKFKEYILNNKFNKDKILLEINAFISEREIGFYKEIIQEFVSQGINKFVLNNISQVDLFGSKSNDVLKVSGVDLYTWNAYTARALKDFDVNYYFTSLEDDIVNLRKLGSSDLGSRLIVTVFGFITIARSRMMSKNTDFKEINSLKEDCSLKHIKRGEVDYLITKTPYMIFNSIDKLKSFGIKNYCIDLSNMFPNKRFLKDIIMHMKKRKNFNNSFKFNIKRGVK